MTTETTARQPKGIPVGGQFAATTHAEPDVALAAPGAGLTFTADFADDLIPEHKAAIEQHWRGRLENAGITGEMTVLSIDGGDEDAGGPTVAGEWMSLRATSSASRWTTRSWS